MFTPFASGLALAIRRLRKAPSTSLPALLAISLAGAALMLATALVEGVLHKPLPYPQSEQLHYLGWRGGPGAGPVSALTAEQARFLLDHGKALATLGSYADPGTQFILDGAPGELAQRIPGMRADAGLLPALGVTPQRGRGFRAEEAKQGSRVAIVSERIWRENLGSGEPGSAQLRIDGEMHQIIGILPADFRFYPAVDLLVPSEPGGIGAGGSNTHLLARLPAQVDAAAVQGQLEALARRAPWNNPAEAAGAAHPRLQPLAERIVGDSRRLLAPLIAAVGALVLLACANVANLLVGYSLSRRGDAAVEMALGATRGHLARRLLVDTALLWGSGLLLGALLAAGLLPQLPGWLPYALPRLDEVALDASSLGLALLFGAVATLLCWALGVVGARLGSVATDLRSQGAGRGADVGLQPLLVAAQVALSCILLVGCALVLGGALRTLGSDPGFRSDGLQTVQLALADARYRDEELASARTLQLLQAIEQALAGNPRLGGSASSSSLPLEQGLNNWVELPPGAAREGESVEVRVVSDSYFRLLGVSLLAGDGFDGSQRAEAEPQLVINAALARAHFGEAEAALGASLGMDGRRWRVIGVVADLREAGLRVAPLPTVFVAQAQMDPGIQAAINRWFLPTLLVDGPAGEVESAVREALRRIDPGVALVRTRPLSSLIGASLAVERFFAGLLSALAAVSLLLTAIGLYGVLAQLQWLRRHELAVRLALGGDAGGNALLLLRQGLRWMGLGLAIGLPAALLAQPLLGFLLDHAGLGENLPWLLAAGAALVTTCALACLLPMARARQIQPVQALRPL